MKGKRTRLAMFLVALFVTLPVVGYGQTADDWYNSAIDASDPYTKIDYYTKAIELDPGYADAYYNRGNAYAGEGLYEEAIADYTRYIELDPMYADAYYNRGQCYHWIGRDERALSDYNKACSLGHENGCNNYNVLRKRLGR
jgi:tetratricopeptide (TPR) repeat protein